MHIQLFMTAVPLAGATLKGKAVVVIDVLRSSTSICAALSAGAKGIIPTNGPGVAGDIFTKLGADNAVLAGEREGKKIENFNFGNSPAEFTHEEVSGMLVIMTTTNGTGIFAKAATADMVLSCGLVNMSAVCDALAEADKDVVIVCAGRDGGFSVEDTLAGGMIIDRLENRQKDKPTLDDAASVARMLYLANKNRLAEAVAEGEHGRYLKLISFESDIRLATDIDSIPVLPVLKDGKLILLSGSKAGQNA